jgi:hypothetical protein
VKNWVEDRKTITSAKIAEWKAKQEVAKLHAGADRAELYAAAVTYVAAVDEAELASSKA